MEVRISFQCARLAKRIVPTRNTLSENNVYVPIHLFHVNQCLNIKLFLTQFACYFNIFGEMRPELDQKKSDLNISQTSKLRDAF